MRSRIVPLAFALAVVLAMGSAVVWALQAGGSGKEESFFENPVKRLFIGHIGRLLLLKSELDITGEQRQKIRDILTKHKGQILPTVKTVVEKRRTLREPVLKEGTDEKAVRAAAMDLAQSIADGAVLASRVIAEIRPVLTPKQLDLMSEFKVSSDKATSNWLEELGKK